MHEPAAVGGAVQFDFPADECVVAALQIDEDFALVPQEGLARDGYTRFGFAWDIQPCDHCRAGRQRVGFLEEQKALALHLWVCSRGGTEELRFSETFRRCEGGQPRAYGLALE